jgi:pyruvate kinase
MQITDTNARMTPEDIAVLKAMFEDREGAVEAIRKIFYPELTAANPISINNDFLTQLNISEMTPEQALLAVTARQQLVRHVEGCFQVIKTLIGKKSESPEQILARLQKDSAK